MPPVFLIGGGGDHPERAETYGRFLQAATAGGGTRIALVVTADIPEEAQDTYRATRGIFANLGAHQEDVVSIFVSPTEPLTRARLVAAAPAGLFVCGGPTPLYQESLCRDLAWLDYLRAANIPFGGVSAGAAVAAVRVIVGGWQAEHAGRLRPILYQGASEGLDLLDVHPGLGLVPFTVEIHASQWGTLTRLLHAIDLGLAGEGWAIDEHTLLQIDPTGTHVHGAGQAYHLVRAGDAGDATRVTIHPAA